MNSDEMTPMERVLTSLDHEEPDRVPFFLLLTTQGAKELNIPVNDYFSKPDTVASTQIRMQQKYGHDCHYNFYYASLEIEAWGGDSIFYPDAAPNCGRPIIRNVEDIASLEAPDVYDSVHLQKVLKTTELIKAHAGQDIPVIGVVMSPSSLATMQLGMDRYFDLMYASTEILDELMSVNEEFCVQWANAQLEAGATAICYFDPVSSSTIIPPHIYRETGFKIARRCISRINGPVATHMASGRCLPIIDDIAATGTAVVCTSAIEDLAEIKAACNGKVSVLGNLNGIGMRHWTDKETEMNVKEVIQKAATGGGYILSDNHGEIPYTVPSDVLMSISRYVKKWGQYPR
ncbi:MAG: uroporphyrinogen decarboxylase family protein [Methanolobus sp.]|nr:uroporphyrinogen decarboxylase family protein [Methanolobus sp.]